MLYENNKAYGAIVNTASVPFLPTYASQNGDRLNERKGKSLRLAKLYYIQADTLESNKAEAMRKRAGRVFGCCSRRELAVGAGGYAYNLHTHRCRDRNCVECQRVRAFVLQQKIREITPELIKQTDAKDGLIFGTLTVKNPLITELKDYLKILSKAFARLMRRKEFKVGVGGFRCFEVTRGEAGSEFCHPHIHFLLQVKASYFSRNSSTYIKSEEWATAWTDCLKLEVEKIKSELNNNQAVFYSAVWDDDHKYIAFKTTEAEALEKKRSNMVKSAFNTLKIQIESKIRILDIIEQSIKKRDIFKTQEEINNINVLSERIFKTFKRLERLGEVKEEKSGFNQDFHNYNFSNEIYRSISDVLNPEKIAEIERIRREILEAVEVFDMTDNLPF